MGLSTSDKSCHNIKFLASLSWSLPGFYLFFLFSDQIPQQTREQNTNLMQAVHSVMPQGTTALLCNIPVVTISWQHLCEDRRKIPKKLNESNHKKCVYKTAGKPTSISMNWSYSDSGKAALIDITDESTI